MRKSLFAVLLCAVAGFAASPFAQAAAAASLQLGTKGSEMAFDKVKLTAKAGQKIKLVFTNHAAKDSGMEHNWVLVNPGTGDAVGQAGMSVGPEKAYTPDSADVLAHTALVKPGANETIEFTAPAKAGEYPYICTFPGHYTMMKGVLEVK